MATFNLEVEVASAGWQAWSSKVPPTSPPAQTAVLTTTEMGTNFLPPHFCSEHAGRTLQCHKLRTANPCSCLEAVHVTTRELLCRLGRSSLGGCVVIKGRPHAAFPLDWHLTNLAHDSPMADKLYQIHGWLLWFAFGLAFPLGIIVSKYFKKRLSRHWFNLHWILQVLGVAATTAGVTIGLVKFNAFWNTLHSKLGFVLAIVIWVQFILGLIRPRTYSRARAAWFFFHWLLGTGSVIVGWYTIYEGFHAYERRDGYANDLWVFEFVFLVQISILGFIYLLLDRWDHLRFQTLG